MTDSNTGALRYAPAGSPMHTTVPRGRTYCAICQYTYSYKTSETYLRSLLERLLVHGDEDDSMRSEAILSSVLDIGDEILACAEVDEL